MKFCLYLFQTIFWHISLSGWACVIRVLAVLRNLQLIFELIFVFPFVIVSFSREANKHFDIIFLLALVFISSEANTYLCRTHICISICSCIYFPYSKYIFVSNSYLYFYLLLYLFPVKQIYICVELSGIPAATVVEGANEVAL